FGVSFLTFEPQEFGLGSGNLVADVYGDGGSHLIMAPGGTLQANVYQHVALTYDKTSGVARLYRNGEVVAQQNMGNFTPLTSYDRSEERRVGKESGARFGGLNDEVGVYSRALGSDEVAWIYNAGSFGKCAP